MKNEFIPIHLTHIPSFEELQEAEFRKNVKYGTDKMLQEFSFKEQMSVSFLPLIIENLAWFYADKVLEQAARDRIELLKKLGRAVKHVKQVYYEELKKDLNYRHLKTIESISRQFREKFDYHFTIFWFTCNREFKRTMPNYPYIDMRTDAIVALLMIRFLREHNRKMDGLIAQKLGHCEHSVMKPAIDKLENCMDAYAGEMGKYDFQNKDITLCINILRNNLEKIEFQLDD